MASRISARGPTSRSGGSAGTSFSDTWAPWSEIGRWAMVAVGVAAVLLATVLVLAGHDRGNASIGLSSGLLSPQHDLSDALGIFQRNLLVLGIHLCACWIGAIVARPYTPAPASLGHLGALHRPVPAWVERMSLHYALAVTLLSVAVQAVGLGHNLANLHAATDIACSRLLWLVLPHATPELVAVFLPLGLFLIQARRGVLDRLGQWSLQAAALALPLLFLAALIETYITPGRILAASPFHLAVLGPILHFSPASFG